jgi:copper chaperone
MTDAHKAESPPTALQNDDEFFSLAIEGMHCGGCVRRVTAALEKVPGVEVADVQVGSARGSYDPNETSRDELVRAVFDLGFRVTGDERGPAPGQAP